MSHKLNLDLGHLTLEVKHKPKSCHLAPRLDEMAFRLSLCSGHVAPKFKPLIHMAPMPRPRLACCMSPKAKFKPRSCY